RAVDVFLFQGALLHVVLEGKIPHGSESCINQRDFPIGLFLPFGHCQVIVNLSGAGNNSRKNHGLSDGMYFYRITFQCILFIGTHCGMRQQNKEEQRKEFHYLLSNSMMRFKSFSELNFRTMVPDPLDDFLMSTFVARRSPRCSLNTY